MILVDANLRVYPTNHSAPEHLAALAIEHGLTVCSTDGDFAHFKGVSWVNPLSA